MTSPSRDTPQVASLVAAAMDVAASSRSRNWSRDSSNCTYGRPVQPRSPTCVEVKRHGAEAMNAPGINRAHTGFWCEGRLGNWNGLCGHRVLPGEAYVQADEHRLCLACAEIEAKQVAAAEKTFTRALLEGVKEALGGPVRSAWNFGTSAGPSPSEENSIENKRHQSHDASGTMPLAQMLLNEKEQLANIARSQETITRILEDERRHRERLAGITDRPALSTADEPIDEEVTLLVQGIAEEVAVIGVLCDTLQDRLESVCRNVHRI